MSAVQSVQKVNEGQLQLIKDLSRQIGKMNPQCKFFQNYSINLYLPFLIRSNNNQLEENEKKS